MQYSRIKVMEWGGTGIVIGMGHPKTQAQGSIPPSISQKTMKESSNSMHHQTWT